jgi:Family of unknown function (DUF6328)
MELLQGFRVAVTGVQVLFAFLLTIPFAARFTTLDDTGRKLFYVALFGAALASVLFIAPVIQHRILFQLGQKPLLIKRANLYGILAAVTLAVSIIAAITLIIQTLVSDRAAVITAVVVGALTLWTWFVQPALSRRGATTKYGDATERADEHEEAAGRGTRGDSSATAH